MMPLESMKTCSRHEFWRAAARYPLLAALAVLSSVLAVKHRSRAGEGACLNRGLCHGCGVFSSCGLPPALAARHTPTRT